MEGFLGTGATFLADFNLIVQLAMGVALLFGMMLARRKRYSAHKYCQSSVMLLNVVMIALIMAPSFRHQVASQIPAGLGDSYSTVATVHAVLGTIAGLLGLYIILVAATNLLPQRLRLERWKFWMRIELVLWWVVVLLGVGTYYIWYLGPSGQALPWQGAAGAHRVAVKVADLVPRGLAEPRHVAAKPDRVPVKVVNFEFTPRVVTIVAGTTLEWINEKGGHTVEADDGSFTSPTLDAGDLFEHTFDRPGEFPYHCGFHGEKGGKGMGGVVKVLPRAG